MKYEDETESQFLQRVEDESHIGVCIFRNVE